MLSSISIEMIIWFLYFLLLIWGVTLIEFFCCLTRLISWDKSHFVFLCELFYFYVAVFSFLVFYGRFLRLYSQELLVFVSHDALVWSWYQEL